jgi:hypothetical protein
MGRQCDENENRHAESNLGRIEVGAVAADHAFLFQPLAAP